MHAKTRGFSLGKPMRATPTPDGKQVLFLRATAASPELRLYSLDVAAAGAVSSGFCWAMRVVTHRLGEDEM